MPYPSLQEKGGNIFPSKPAVVLRSVLVLVQGGVASSVFGPANRVFVPARSGNDANSCGNIATP